MSLDYVKFSNGFEKFMPKEYRDMVEHGPFGDRLSEVIYVAPADHFGPPCQGNVAEWSLLAETFLGRERKESVPTVNTADSSQNTSSFERVI